MHISERTSFKQKRPIDTLFIFGLSTHLVSSQTEMHAFFQSTMAFLFSNIFSHVINLLLTKLGQDSTGRISALGSSWIINPSTHDCLVIFETLLIAAIVWLNIVQNGLVCCITKYSHYLQSLPVLSFFG